MTWTSPDRWSCPACHATTVFEGSPASVDAHRRKVQLEHGKRHRKERLAVVRLEMALSRGTRRKAA